MTRGWPSPAEIARLRVAVAAMPEPRRSVYLLCARDRLDHSQVAARLGISVRQVERYLAEAVMDLMRAFDDDSQPIPTLQ
jgi:DNA-directed RNA polymerase specialized sigma24 family protein